MLGETKRAGRHKAHTLVEILFVVTLVGLVAGLVTVMIADAMDHSDEDEARRAARQVVSIFDAAKSAGVDSFVRDNEGRVLNKAAVVDRVSAGKVVPEGPLAGVYLGVAMTDGEQRRALRYLAWDPKRLALEYNPAGIE